MATRTEASAGPTTGVAANRTLIDATTARRKATSWVVTYVGDALMGVEPQFVESDQPVWRVSIVLAYARQGILGEVGSLEVDASSGEVLVTDSQIKEIKKAATTLAKRSPALAR